MLFNYHNYKVVLACGKTDLRKNINGLCEIVQHTFSLDPREPMIFAFCNRERNRVKPLVWEDNGSWVHQKRFEKGRIPWPTPTLSEMTMDLYLEDFENVLRFPGIRQKIKRDEVWKKC